MDRPLGKEITLRSFLKQAFTKPISIIQSEDYLPFGKNMLFLIMFFLLSIFLSTVIRIIIFPYRALKEDDMRFLIELLSTALSLFFLFPFVIIVIINILVIYFITRRKKRLDEIASDHSVVSIYAIILFLLGMMVSTVMISDGYATTIPLYFFIFALIIYIAGSSFILHTYLDNKIKPVITFVYFVFLVILIIQYIGTIIVTFAHLLWG